MPGISIKGGIFTFGEESNITLKNIKISIIHAYKYLLL